MTIKELYEEAIKRKCENAEIYHKPTNRIQPIGDFYTWYNSSEAPNEMIVVLE